MMQQNLAVSSEFNDKLESLHLDSVAQDLVNLQGWTRQRADRAIAGWKQHLVLTCQNPGEMLVPTEDIDFAGHAHMSMGTQFDRDCQRLFGCVVLHEPGLGNGDDTNKREWAMAFLRTKWLFQKAFGVNLIDDPAHCFTVAVKV